LYPSAASIEIKKGTNYPKFVWKIPIGNFVCPDSVGILDLTVFASHWLEEK
jgi:hypothetical protein